MLVFRTYKNLREQVLMRLDYKSMDEKDDTVLIVKQQIYLHFSTKKINKHDNLTGEQILALEQNALIK